MIVWVLSLGHEAELNSCQAVLLVGGFGESPWLFQHLSSRLQGLGLSLSRPDTPTCAFLHVISSSLLTVCLQEQSSSPGSHCVFPGWDSQKPCDALRVWY